MGVGDHAEPLTLALVLVITILVPTTFSLLEWLGWSVDLFNSMLRLVLRIGMDIFTCFSLDYIMLQLHAYGPCATPANVILCVSHVLLCMGYYVLLHYDVHKHLPWKAG